MTDKIIIDGVDVSKCYRYKKKTGYCEGAFKPEELPFCQNFDCYYKQFKRKEQECDNYKQALDDLESICRNLLDDDYMRSIAKSLLHIIYKAKEQ